MAANPWAVSRTESATETPESPAQEYNAYAVPALSAGDAYMDEFGWAPNISGRPSAQETPDAHRLGTIPLYQRNGKPNGTLMHDGLTDRLDVDNVLREHVGGVNVVSTGWVTAPGLMQGDRRWSDNPRRDPPAEPRITSRLAQNTWSFTRFFDQLNRIDDGEHATGSARRFNGLHFSMADHRRNYEIYGMRPATSRRNTYRIEPTPWDVDIVDLPPEANSNIPETRILGIELPYQSRSLRLS